MNDLTKTNAACTMTFDALVGKGIPTGTARTIAIKMHMYDALFVALSRIAALDTGDDDDEKMRSVARTVLAASTVAFGG